VSILAVPLDGSTLSIGCQGVVVNLPDFFQNYRTYALNGGVARV